MFEPAAHTILSNGGTFRIIPLDESQACKRIHWKTPENLSEQVPIYLCFTSNGIRVNGEAARGNIGGQPRAFELPPKKAPLNDFGYYRPSSGSEATYDGVAYKPKSKHARIFQVTPPTDHSVKASGIQNLLDRGIQKISYFAVTPPNTTIDLACSKKVNEVVLHKYQLWLE
jgi:hypothetical protein